MSAIPAFLAFELAALLLAGQWFVGHRSIQLRGSIRAFYAAPLPYSIRTFSARGVLWAPLVGLAGVMFVVARDVAVLLAAVLFAGVALAFLVSHVRPALLLPQWIRNEIEQGTLALAVPTGLDWAYFWLFFPIAIVTAVGVLLIPPA